MGLYDRLTFEDGLDVQFPPLEADPFDIRWQSKSIGRRYPALENYKVTVDRRLFKEDAEYEHVPEEERPGYDPDIDGFENSFEKYHGCIRKVPLGWSDVDYHGTFEFHRSIDGEYVSLEAKFTDGQLVETTRTQ